MRAKRMLVGVGAFGLSVLAITHGAFFSAIGAPTAASSPAQTMLELAGIKQGYVVSVSGGDVTTATHGTSPVTKASPVVIAATKISPFEIKTGLSMGHDYFFTIEQAISGQAKLVDGEFLSSDTSGNVTSRPFHNGLITSVTFPKLDGSSKDPAFLTVQLSPQTVQPPKASTTSTQGTFGTSNRVWRSSDFKLTLDSLDCTHVSEIDPISVLTPASISATGAPLAAAVPPVSMTFRIPTTAAAAFLAAQQSSTVRTGKITFLTADLKNEHFEIDFSGVQISQVSTDSAAAQWTVVRATSARVVMTSPQL